MIACPIDKPAGIIGKTRQNLLMRSLKLNLFFFLCLLPFVPDSGDVFADYIPPDQTHVKIEHYVPQYRDYAEGKFRYQVSWQGVPVAEAEVEIKRTKVGETPFLIVRTHARTEEAIDMFYHLRHTTESMFDARTLEPLSYYSFQLENRRAKLLEMRFDRNGAVDIDQWKNGELSETHSYNLDNRPFDPISAAFMARSLPLEVGKKMTVDVFNGKNRYLVEFEVLSKELLWMNKQERMAYKVQPRVTKLTDTEGEKRLESATLWVSADERRDVLKIESKVKVGRITAELER